MVRIWSVPIQELNRQHLLGEHAELHIIYSVLVNHKKGYSRHPETLRFQSRVNELRFRHSQQVAEMQKRGYKHNSPITGETQTYSYTTSQYILDHADLIQRQAKQK